MDQNPDIAFFGKTDSRGKHIPFGIKADDRSRHMYVIGKTGMGKSTLLENLAVQDIQNGNGVTFIDPHGSTAETLLEYIPEHRVKDLLYFAPFDMGYPVSFNVMEDVDPDKRFLVVNGLMATFEKIWADAWSARMAYILQNTIGALLEWPNATILSVNRMYTDKVFRKQVVNNVTDPTVKAFWEQEFAGYTDRFAAEATPAIQNKIGQFASNALIRNIIGQPHSAFDMRELMDNKKIFIVNLSKGRVGEGNANLLGSMLITKLYLAAMSRADAGQAEMHKLPPHYLYVDEFQSFANKSFADILSEARKYKLALTIAHQYIEQMEEEVRAAVFGNVGTMITFRVGSYDAEVLEKEFSPIFTMTDIVNLGKHQIYLKLMIDGVASQPFSATTLPPIETPKMSYRDMAIAHSRRTYSRPRDEVEKEIAEWHMPPEPQNNKPAANKRREKPPEVSPFAKIRQAKTDDAPEGNLKSILATVTKEKEEEKKPETQPAQQEQKQEKREENQRPQNTTQQPPARVVEKQETPEARVSDRKEQQSQPMRKAMQQPRAKDDGKGATAEEKNDLKAALAALVGGNPPQQQTRDTGMKSGQGDTSGNKRRKRNKDRRQEREPGQDQSKVEKKETQPNQREQSQTSDSRQQSLPKEQQTTSPQSTPEPAIVSDKSHQSEPQQQAPTPLSSHQTQQNSSPAAQKQSNTPPQPTHDEIAMHVAEAAKQRNAGGVSEAMLRNILDVSKSDTSS